VAPDPENDDFFLNPRAADWWGKGTKGDEAYGQEFEPVQQDSEAKFKPSEGRAETTEKQEELPDSLDISLERIDSEMQALKVGPNRANLAKLEARKELDAQISHFYSKIVEHNEVTGRLKQILTCKICRLQTSRLYNMKDHVSKHLDIRPYECPSCHERFP